MCLRFYVADSTHVFLAVLIAGSTHGHVFPEDSTHRHVFLAGSPHGHVFLTCSKVQIYEQLISP
jgi:hypothetical protein